MDTLVEVYSLSMTELNFNHHSIPATPIENGYKQINHSFTHPPVHSNRGIDGSTASDDASPFSGVSSVDRDMPVEIDHYDGVLKFINQTLMEEDLENKPCMFVECSALQAAEKSFYDVLGEKYPPSVDQHLPCAVDHNSHQSPDSDFSEICNSHTSNSSGAVNYLVEYDQIHDQSKFKTIVGQSFLVGSNTFQSNLQSFHSSSSFYDAVHGLVDSHVSPFQVLDSSKSRFIPQFRGDQRQVTNPSDSYGNYDIKPTDETSRAVTAVEHNGRDHSPDWSRGKKNHYREDSDYGQEGRSNKQLASYADDPEQLEKYDKVFLCDVSRTVEGAKSELYAHEDASEARTKLQQNGQSKGSNAGRPRGKRQGSKKEVVDLRSLLTQCAQAVTSTNIKTADELLKRIRQHSSPYGDGTERLAHYFANAIEARLAGTGTSLYSAFTIRRHSAADTLKAYEAYVTACPFHRMSNIVANKSIKKLVDGKSRLHIIDFGILYGFQWPCLLKGLSLRLGGPPRIRITGIDLPQPGFRPAERVEETGRRLENYCKRFNIPFKYNAIAKKWDTIKLEELQIDRDETLVVNCLYRLRNVHDETVVVDSPRDAVLNLIKKINPDMFVHGVVNGTYNAPFFLTRFREALFHYSTLFDMFEATAPRENKERLLFEQEVFAREAMNIIACEGTERIERPETYKQWQFRNIRAGFRQLPLHQDIMQEVRAKVKLLYHKDFSVDDESRWMLQGWKGRVIYALSYWKPVQCD